MQDNKEHSAEKQERQKTLDHMLEPGRTATVTTTVNCDNTARAVGSGSLDVFSTPMMIALMESAACLCLSDCLEDDLTSVGTFISVEHTSASPVGAKISARARVESVTQRVIEFSVEATDEAGVIGHGRHTRAVVSAQRLTQKAENRLK